jgi:hypothetical protein
VLGLEGEGEAAARAAPGRLAMQEDAGWPMHSYGNTAIKG